MLAHFFSEQLGFQAYYSICMFDVIVQVLLSLYLTFNGRNKYFMEVGIMKKIPKKFEVGNNFIDSIRAKIITKAEAKCIARASFLIMNDDRYDATFIRAILNLAKLKDMDITKPIILGETGYCIVQTETPAKKIVSCVSRVDGEVR